MLHLTTVALFTAWQVLLATWQVLGDMSPYLLFGFALAGLLSIWISPQWTERHLGGRGFGPVLRATLFGIPLPLCSCSVIPVVVSMRRHGASRAASTSFLLSTPQTGIDSIAVTYALLGPMFAIFRPIAAIVSGLLGGLLVLLFGESGGNRNEAGEAPHCHDACCSDVGAKSAWRRALRHGFIALPRDVALPLLLGAVVAGAMTVFWPAQHLKTYLGAGLPSILLLMAVAIPLYVCATASIPIAAGLIYSGASPGAALAFLIVGAATNPAALATVWKVLGRRTTVLYLLTTALSAAICAGLLNAMPATWFQTLTVGDCLHHEMTVTFTASLWAAALLVVFGVSFEPWRYGNRTNVAAANDSKAAKSQRTGDCCRPATLQIVSAPAKNSGPSPVDPA